MPLASEPTAIDSMAAHAKRCGGSRDRGEDAPQPQRRYADVMVERIRELKLEARIGELRSIRGMEITCR